MFVAPAPFARKLSSPSLVLSGSVPTRQAQIGARVATVAALGWFLLGLESILRPQPRDLRDVLFHLPWILTLVTFWFVHRVQGPSAVPWERTTFVVLIVTMLVVTLGSMGMITRTSSLQPLAFPWGVLVWMIAMVVYGIATRRTRLLPRSAALAFLFLEPGSILLGLALNPIVPIHDHGGYSGAVAKGFALAAMARGLRDVAQSAEVGPFASETEPA